MDFQESINYLNTLTDYEVKRKVDYEEKNYNLKRTDKLLKKTDISQGNAKIFHVAGTNGKGFCANAFHILLINNGVNCGLFTSPHIFNIRERIKVGKNYISEADFASAVKYVKTYIDKMTDKPTYFEALTVIAMFYFIKKKCTWIVLETGMGGRLDSTNVFKPEICVITSIGLDHTDKLGSTEIQIAFEKAGIIKRGKPLILGNIKGKGKEVILQKAEELDCPVYEYSDDFFAHEISVSMAQGTRFIYKPSNIPVNINALTESAAINTSIAIKAAEIINLENKNDFSGFKLPCRFEIINKKPIIILSAAHNASAAKDLINTVKNVFGQTKMHFIFGFLKGKDFLSFFKETENLAHKITVFKIDNANDNSAEVFSVLKKRVDNIEFIQSASNLNTRIKQAGCSVNIITGSFYLCSQILKEKHELLR